ncbi:MAG: type II toxin-antitoxin system prevent-host-death family antitoxin [Clostridiales bacterium]|nr:type II toxin-antitoxin system prevent-host-death family antitoxin [Clostridiales bacterium]
MIVSSTEIQNNFGKYLQLTAGQEIVITKNGSAVAKLIGINKKTTTLSSQLCGIIPFDIDENEIKVERMSRH